METTTQFLIILSAFWLIVVGVFMLVHPHAVLRYIGKFASTNLIHYLELVLRLILGVSLIFFADLSKSPMTLNFFGVILIGTTTILFLVPRKLHAKLANFFSHKLTVLHMRLSAPFAIGLGIFLVYAVL